MPSKMRMAWWLPALILAGLYAGAACSNDGMVGSNDGRLRVVLSAEEAGAAAPARGEADHEDDRDDDIKLKAWFQSAQVTLSSVLVRNFDGELIDADLDLPVTVDVVKVEGGKRIVLTGGALPAGTYDQVVFVMTAVSGTTHDGTIVTIQPPGGGWTAVVPICPLMVEAGATETLEISLNVRNSFLKSGSHWGFHPKLRSKLNCPAANP